MSLKQTRGLSYPNFVRDNLFVNVRTFASQIEMLIAAQSVKFRDVSEGDVKKNGGGELINFEGALRKLHQ